MKLLHQLAGWIAAMAAMAAVKCSVKPDAPTPEELINHQPSGAGLAEEAEPRPGYLKPGIKPIPSTKERE